MSLPPTIALDLDVAPLPPREAKPVEGQGVRILVSARDAATGEPVAASGLRVLLRAPGAAVPTAFDELDPVALGRWALDAVLAQGGRWWVRAECTGPRPAAREAAFEVRASAVLEREPPEPLLVTPDGAPIVTPDGAALTARRLDLLPALGVPGADDILPVVRAASPGTLRWSDLRDAAEAAAAAARDAAQAAQAGAEDARGAAEASAAAGAGDAAAAGAARTGAEAAQVAAASSAGEATNAAAAASASATGAAGSASAAAGSLAAAQALTGGAQGIGGAPLSVPRNAELGSAAYMDEMAIGGIFPAEVNSAFTIRAQDHRRLLYATSGSPTYTLPRAADLPPGWWCLVKARGTTVAVVRAGADTLDGGTSLSISTGTARRIVRASATSFEAT